MYRKRLLFATSKLGVNNAFTHCRWSSKKTLKTDKILVVSKLSRYEFEKKKHKNLEDTKLLGLLKVRGTDTEKLVHHHDLHKRFQDNVVVTLQKMGISVEVVNRFTCARDHIDEADVVMPVGGDGTFLLAASRVRDNRKPVVGLNSDPNRSEGHLCVPRRYSADVRRTVERLQRGDFEWLMRSRIRTTMVVYEEENLVPQYIHDIEGDCAAKSHPNNRGNVLPVLALNEVFVGEKTSARVSHLSVRPDGAARPTNVKCSGVCASTGTGSTSWHLSINRMPVQNVADLLRLIDASDSGGEGDDDGRLASVLADAYNRNLVFAADDQRMAYTIRELISAGVWPEPKGIRSRGFVSKLEIKSNCFDASLVVDGGVSFVFNDGATAVLEIRPEDALRTVVFED